MNQLIQSTTIVGCLIATLTTGVLFAQDNRGGYHHQDNGDSSSAEYVTVYQDCDFRGKSRALTVGDFNDVRDLNIGNDSISSIEVPDGLRITLYEHELLRGKSTFITSDVPCLNQQWNDQASSLRVSHDAQSNHNYRVNSQNDKEHGGNLTRGIAYVAFANTSLERSKAKQWRMVNSIGDTNFYRETSRDNRAIFLHSTRFDQQVKIDLYTNRVHFYVPGGQNIEYMITNSGVRPKSQKTISPAPLQPDGLIKRRCFSYKAYTDGGIGGIRFHGHDGFHRFYKKGHRGRLCHDGALTMELNKNEPATVVIVEINGEQYRFAKNEKADVFKNTWYRKRVTLQVGH